MKFTIRREPKELNDGSTPRAGLWNRLRGGRSAEVESGTDVESEGLDAGEISPDADEQPARPLTVREQLDALRQKKPAGGATKRASSKAAGLKAPNETGKVKKAGISFGKKPPVDKVENISSDTRFEDGVLWFGKKASVVGLVWDPVRTGSSIKAQASELDASSDGAEPRKHKLWIDNRRLGWVAFTDGTGAAKVGMTSLPTMFPPSVVGDRWLGIFNLQEGTDVWWLGGGRNGVVYEDQVIRGRQAAEDAFLREVDAPDLVNIFAPADWNIRGSRHEPIWELVRFNAGAKLRHVRPIVANLPRIIIAALLIGATYTGITMFQNMKEREILALEEIRRQMREEVTVSPSDMPWDKMTRVRDYVRICAEEIEKSIVLASGWEAQPISCTIEKGQGVITTGWTTSGGRFSWLRAGVPADAPQPVLAPDGRSASWSRPFEASFETSSFTDDPWPEEKIEAWMRERFQTYGLDVSLRPAQENKAVANARPQFNATDVRINTAVGLANYGDFLVDVPALRATVVIYNVQTAGWDLVMKAYHPVLMPPVKK